MAIGAACPNEEGDWLDKIAPLIESYENDTQGCASCGYDPDACNCGMYQFGDDEYWWRDIGDPVFDDECDDDEEGWEDEEEEEDDGGSEEWDDEPEPE